MNDRFEQAIALIDAENSKDPRHEMIDGTAVPHELLYARRLTDWVLRLDPNASEALRLAARSQHICRWKIPRSEYPTNKAGYHRWKNELKQFHANLTESLLNKAGYDDSTISRVKALNLKSGFPDDPETRTLEDALCLVFLEHQLRELAVRSKPEKLVNALRKSWNKMTQKARYEALQLKYSSLEQHLLNRALGLDQADS